ncbi:mechanosensitive ion channel family protein [Sphingosinicella humi]|uniref:Mechanosensitive ion channel protein MscS n=1 Tax=Allosphingosinicella humi TaxID=2068657 RepID=A0A2U2J1G2_9SPHN|nr:mechanosensitive ion channel family protein [Sphingosinicella humi]PWG02180.1 mechanosensitive ion channel protein MscS [Sphingosinicella humi]
MANANNASVADAAENLSEASLDLVGETARWITSNGVDILIGGAVAAVIALILLGLRAFGDRMIGDTSADQKWRTIFGRVLSKTNLFFIVMVAATLVVDNTETPALLTRVVNFLFVVSAAFQAAIWARELILGLVYHRVGVADESSTLGSAIGIIHLLVTVGLFAIAIILILDNLGVNVTGLVAGLGIGGIAIGLAAQGIFSDLFAALSIIFDKPFRRGDGIRFDTVSGTVEHIGLKTTRIRALDGEEVVVSNANLLNKEVHNFANLEHRRFVLKLGVIYQTPVDVLAGIPEMIRDLVESHPDTKMIRCGMVGFGPSSLDFELQFDIHSTDYELAFLTRSAICLEILEAFNDAGIEFAYPTQTTFTAAPDGRMVMPYADVKLVAAKD